MSNSKKREVYKSAINEYYIREDAAYISCNVHDYYDVIDSYSSEEHGWPKSEFVQYVEENASNIPVEYPIVLELCGASFTENQKAAIEKGLNKYYTLKLGESQKVLSGKGKKAFVLFLFTILSAAALFAFYQFGGHVGLLEETLLVVFWFFLWECGDVVAFESRRERKRRAGVEQLASIRVEFKEPEQKGKIIEMYRSRQCVGHP